MNVQRRSEETARTLWTGGFHNGLEDALLEHLATRRAGAALTPLSVAVPTNLLRQRLSRRLADKVGGHLGVAFRTLKDLAAEGVGPAFLANRSLLPSGAEDVILRRLIADGLLKDGYFDAVADRPGIPGVLLRALRTLRESGFSLDGFERAAAAAGLLKGGRGSKFAEILRVWKALESETARHRWCDDLHIMFATIETFEKRPPEPAPVIYGFYDLNATQRRLIAASLGSGPATVFVPWEDVESCRYALPTVRWFEELGFARRAVCDGPPSDLPLPGDTTIVSAPGEEREARETLRLAVEAMERGDVAGQDVAVLMRSPDTVGDFYARDLEALGFSAYIESPRALASTREGRTMRALVRAVESGFGRVEVMEFLELSELEVEGGAAPLAAWARASSLAGITSGAARWISSLERLERRLDRGEDDRFAVLHAGLRRPVRSLLALLRDILPPLERLPRSAPLGRHLDELLRVFERVRPDTRMPSPVVDAVEDLRRLEPFAGSIGFATAAELVRGALSSPTRRGLRFGQGGPNVLSLMGARGLSFRTVIVPGLVEKSFPLPRRQDPILLDSERRALDHRRDDGGFLPARADGASEEELLFRIAVGSAERSLILSFPRLDVAKGRPRIPSIFLLETLERLTGKPHDYDAFDRSPVVRRIPLSRRFPERRESALTEDEFDGCTVLAALHGDDREAAYLLADHPVRRRGAEMERKRWGSSFFTSYDGAVTSDEARVAVAALSGVGPEGTLPGRSVSPTALEHYAGCPFQYLMQHVLGIEREDPPEDITELSPLDRGSLYHEVLDRFLTDITRDGSLPLDEGDTVRLESAIRAVAGRSGEALPGYGAARELEIEELSKHLGLWLAWEIRQGGRRVPTCFEVAFGGEHAADAASVVFDAGGRSVSFAGRIDRIDVDPHDAEALVIDYKTGKAPTGKNAKGLRHGTRLQLPVYVLAGDEILKLREGGGSIGAALYLHLRESGGPREIAFTREQLDERRDDLEFAVGLILKGIEEGMLFPWPDSGRCRFCNYERACGVIALPLAMMKRGDPRASHFVRGLAEVE
jgi:RecB family exonuclease